MLTPVETSCYVLLIILVILEAKTVFLSAIHALFCVILIRLLFVERF